MLHLDHRHLEIVLKILSKYPHTFYAFGSRVTGKHRALSDLDITYKDNLDYSTKASLRESFDLARLPFEVDILDYNHMSLEFREDIKSSLLVLQQCGPVPDKDVAFPLVNTTRLCFLKNIVKRPNVEIGDYTYYDDPDGVENFERNVLYHFEFCNDRLKIGKFCQIATGFKAIMNGGNHALGGFSTYPFPVFIGTQSKTDLVRSKGDTVIGNDVWIGFSAMVMPGVRIGDGAVIGAGSVVTRDVEPYTIVAGNPAREIKKRFDVKTVEFLQDLRWWDWPIEKIVRHNLAISRGNLEELKSL